MASKIEWTDITWNPVTGCSRISPGCDNCYMFALYPRLKAMGIPGYAESPETVQTINSRLRTPLTWKSPKRVFVNSMADLFHPRVPLAFIHETFVTMRDSSESIGHVFQVLTKRPGRAVEYWDRYKTEFPDGWPPAVWIGTSVENQKYAPRITVLARLPAKVRFVSAEPLIEPLDLSEWLNRGDLNWVIVGGESGPRARPMDPAWARVIRNQTHHAGVPFFLKQLGGRRGKRSGSEALLDGQIWHQFPEPDVDH